MDSAARLTRRCKFGDNEDGNAAADRFVQAGHEFIAAMTNARVVFANLAVTYRVAGRTVTEADAANELMFRSRSERGALRLIALSLLAAGCGSQVPKTATSPAVADASRVDMCTILTDQELAGLGD